ncbi:chromosomal replication initiator protein DnaA [Candidatus Saccharibacteria bacterium]|nr:chromosomal replication initiator protein DnaA [Candidatus Saccharibacteria bacterium]
MDTASLWQSVLGEIELGLSQGNFVTWFKNTRLLKVDDEVVVIGAPNIFIKQQLERKFAELISETLEKNGVKPERIEYKILPASSLHRKVEDTPVVMHNNGHSGPSTSTSGTTSSLTHSYRQGLNEKYTFENFVVGSGNELAYAACQAVAQKPGVKYNPLFIYGGVGIGKTHLIQAVGNEILARNKNARIVYVSSEQFVQEFLDAIRYKKNTDFAGHYRSADVLIIDDVQFIAGKEKTQEEFFHTFNALHQANKQIIISSDTRPKDIPTLTDRLKSRFEWGMNIDMQSPDFETRCVIVQAKAQAHNINLPHDLVEYLAGFVQNNIRELEGALNQLIAFCEMRHLEPSAEVAVALFGNQKNRPRHLTARQIVEKTAKYFHLSVDELIGPKRDKEIVVPRQIAMYIIRSELHMSFPKIARELGRKDHTTAIHSIDKISKEQAFDPEVRAAIGAIKEKL